MTNTQAHSTNKSQRCPTVARQDEAPATHDMNLNDLMARATYYEAISPPGPSLTTPGMASPRSFQQLHGGETFREHLLSVLDQAIEITRQETKWS